MGDKRLEVVPLVTFRKVVFTPRYDCPESVEGHCERADTSCNGSPIARENCIHNPASPISRYLSSTSIEA